MSSSCNATVTPGEGVQTTIVVLGALCALVALFNAMALVLRRLYTNILYRLLLYKMATDCLLSLTMTAGAISYKQISLLYAGSIVVFMTAASVLFYHWFAVHLFISTVCCKNPTFAETFYVFATGLISGGVVALVIAGSALLPAAQACTVNEALWVAYVAMASLPVLSSAIVVAAFLITLCGSRRGPNKRRHGEALRETVPFSVYPLVSSLFLALLLAMSAAPESMTHEFRCVLPQCVCALWTVALTAHLLAVRLTHKCERKSPIASSLESQNFTYGSMQ